MEDAEPVMQAAAGVLLNVARLRELATSAFGLGVVPQVGYCRDCRYWGEPRLPEYDLDGNEVLQPEHRCDRSRSENGHPKDPATLAWARDADLYAASLWTLADFGCVQFEQKETIHGSG